MISYTISNGVVKRTKLTKGGRATVSTQDVHKVFFKWASPGLFYVYFRSFQTNIAIFTTNICEKMSIQYTVPGFEPTTFGARVSSHNH